MIPVMKLVEFITTNSRNMIVASDLMRKFCNKFLDRVHKL
jgi:hypothetical protein